MHNAPAQSYPVGASVLYSTAVLIMTCLGMLTMAIWLVLADTLTLVHQLAIALSLLLWLLAFLVWRHAVPATLSWDGQGWTLVGQSGAIAVMPHVVLDLQRYLLLYLHVDAATATSCWVWPVASSHPVRWPALRWALFARIPANTVSDTFPENEKQTHLNRKKP